MKPSIPCLLGLTISAAFLAIPQSAEAAIVNLTANLSQSQQVYPPAFIPTLVPGASGFADLTYDTDTNLLNWDIIFSGLSGAVTAVHFHGPAPIGANAPVTVDIESISGLLSPLQGSASVTEVQEKDILAGLWYINIHTAANPSGEIRGQVSTVPEPSSLGFLAMAGASFLGYQLRQKKLNK